MFQSKEHQDKMNAAAKKAIQERMVKQKAFFLESFARNLGLLFETCRQIGIAARTVEDWKQKDEGFAEEYHNVSLEQRNYIEGELLNAIKRGDQQNVRFWLKCKHPDYGTKIGFNLDDMVTKLTVEIINPHKPDGKNDTVNNSIPEKSGSPPASKEVEDCNK